MERTISISKPFPEWALPKLWSWISACRSRVCDDFAPLTLDEFMAAHDARAGESFGVWRQMDGAQDLAGFVGLERLNPVSAQLSAVFSKRYWRPEITVPGLRAVVEQAFAERPELLKISAPAFADNRQLIEVFQAAGFEEETSARHPLRACTLRAGKPLDIRLFSKVQEESQCLHS